MVGSRLCGTMLLWALAISGCSLNKFAADQVGSIASSSSVHMRGFWDYEIARDGMASAIMQLESMHSVSPDNEELTLALVSTYVGYAFGWVELDMAKARGAGRFDQADRLRARVELLYRRARDLALGVMRRRDSAVEARLLEKPAELTRYLNDRYSDAESDVAPVFWTAIAWGSLLSVTEQVDLAVDLPTIKALIEHSAKLDPGFESAGALMFLGGFYAQFPAEFGGSPAKGKAYFERALELTGRRAHIVQLNYARLYAHTVGEQALFASLLNEIMAAEDRGGDVRLSNKIARMHAEVLLSSVSHSQ